MAQVKPGPSGYGPSLPKMLGVDIDIDDSLFQSYDMVTKQTLMKTAAIDDAIMKAICQLPPMPRISKKLAAPTPPTNQQIAAIATTSGQIANSFWVTNSTSTNAVTTFNQTVATTDNMFGMDELVRMSKSVLNGASITEWLETHDFTFECPDKAVLKFKRGIVELITDDARVVYKSNPVREFNKYLNASDLLEEFIHWCGDEGLSKRDFKELPVHMFIMWLVVRAAEADQEDPGEVALGLHDCIVDHRKSIPRCKDCGRFITKHHNDNGVVFCTPEHMGRYLEKIA